MTESEMNAPVEVPVLTIDELIRRASVDNDGVGRIAYGYTMSVPKASEIAATSIEYALDDWEFEHGTRPDIPPSMLAVALLRVFDAGWEAREARFEQGRREEEADGRRREMGE